MPSEGISPCLITQIQQAACTICGQNMGSGRRDLQPNYQKQVDPPAAPYKQIIPDWRYDQMVNVNKKQQNDCKKIPAIQICLPCMLAGNKIEKKNDEKKKEEKKKEAECPGVLNAAAMKASCLPLGGGGGQCPPPVKMMLCLPCPPPDMSKQGQVQGQGASCPKSTRKPRDYTYRCESRELRGGNLYTCCQCNKRNGLQHDCPRTPCQGRPACLQKPWPDCWPSGGSHGIDYSRENGVRRYDPCREQRFDKRQQHNAPAGRLPNKPECGGNMMVLVCPAPGR